MQTLKEKNDEVSRVEEALKTLREERECKEAQMEIELQNMRVSILIRSRRSKTSLK